MQLWESAGQQSSDVNDAVVSLRLAGPLHLSVVLQHISAHAPSYVTYELMGCDRDTLRQLPGM